jgi:hypothetical protein
MVEIEVLGIEPVLALEHFEATRGIGAEHHGGPHQRIAQLQAPRDQRRRGLHRRRRRTPLAAAQQIDSRSDKNHGGWASR